MEGNIRAAQGRVEEALELHILGYRIRKEVLGDHIQTAASCYKCGDLLVKTNKLKSAVYVYPNSSASKARSSFKINQYLSLGQC